MPTDTTVFTPVIHGVDLEAYRDLECPVCGATDPDVIRLDGPGYRLLVLCTNCGHEDEV